MNPQFFNLIDIVPDGDCFFRAMTIHINKILQYSKRGRNNQLLDKSLRELEHSTMLAMRLMVVNSIEMDKNKYEKEIFYDKELYDNIDDRIEHMYKKSEFVGFLEVKKMAELFNLQINIFSPIRTTYLRRPKITYNHIGTYGNNSENICNLYLDNNHYDLLILKPKYTTNYHEILNSNSPEGSRKSSVSSETENASEFDYEMVE